MSTVLLTEETLADLARDLVMAVDVTLTNDQMAARFQDLLRAAVQKLPCDARTISGMNDLRCERERGHRGKHQSYGRSW